MNRLLRIALLTWPKTYRYRYGCDLVATALELTNGRLSLREVASMAANGLGARHLAATDGDTRRSWDSAALVCLMLVTGSILGEILHRTFSNVPTYAAADWSETQASALTLSAIGLVALAVLRLRVVAVVLSVLVGVSWFWGPTMSAAEHAAYSIAALAPVWWLALSNERAGPLAVARMLGWVALVVASGLLVDNFYLAHDAAVLIAGLVGLVVVPKDPRLLAGTALFVATRGLVTFGSHLGAELWGNGSWGLGATYPTAQMLALVAMASMGLMCARWALNREPA